MRPASAASEATTSHVLFGMSKNTEGSIFRGSDRTSKLFSDLNLRGADGLRSGLRGHPRPKFKKGYFYYFQGRTSLVIKSFKAKAMESIVAMESFKAMEVVEAVEAMECIGHSQSAKAPAAPCYCEACRRLSVASLPRVARFARIYLANVARFARKRI